MNNETYQFIDSRINTINFELQNYDSEFVLKHIPINLKSAFKPFYCYEKMKELKFLEQMINLIGDEDQENAA